MISVPALGIEATALGQRLEQRGASSSVDLPLPFSPTKNVTLLRNARSIPGAKARMSNGCVLGSNFSGRLAT
jgi:hypothetical protein